MSDIVEFITARLDDDEQIARAAGSGPYARWAYTGEYDSYSGGEVYLPDVDHYSKDIYPYKVTSDNEGLSPSVGPDAGQHIARQCPARTLLEVKAWRGVIDYLDPDGQYDREIFADIAAIWNTHADYQAEWAP